MEPRDRDVVTGIGTSHFLHALIRQVTEQRTPAPHAVLVLFPDGESPSAAPPKRRGEA